MLNTSGGHGLGILASLAPEQCRGRSPRTLSKLKSIYYPALMYVKKVRHCFIPNLCCEFAFCSIGNGVSRIL